MCMKRAVFLAERREVIRKWQVDIASDFRRCGGLVAWMLSVMAEVSTWSPEALQPCGDCPVCLTDLSNKEALQASLKEFRELAELRDKQIPVVRQDFELRLMGYERDHNLADWFRRHPIHP